MGGGEHRASRPRVPKSARSPAETSLVECPPGDDRPVDVAPAPIPSARKPLRSESKMDFVKMHGAGNDYVYADTFAGPLPTDLPRAELARRVAHRRFGVGGDGLILIEPSDVADCRMEMYNADGSRAEMCGNGIRCVAKYVHDHGLCPSDKLAVETDCGVLNIEVHLRSGVAVAATVDMGVPQFDPRSVPTTFGDHEPVVDHWAKFDGNEFQITCVSMGNPHCVIFVPKITDELVLGLGPKIENDPRFPSRTNVEFVEILSRHEVRQRTWERGSGETWACGTGASAVCAAGVRTGRTEPTINNHLLGGDLTLQYRDDRIFMTGPAATVCRGTLDASLLSDASVGSKSLEAAVR